MNGNKIFLLKQNDLDYIESNLCLGNLAAATNPKILEENKIKFILTVNSFSLPKKIYDLEGIHIKFFKVSDILKQDILSYFQETYNFIEYNRQHGICLVHCTSGVSRSAAFIISYLMKKNSWPVKVAYEYAKSKRPHIQPNPSFFSQLQLFQAMKYTIQKNNIQYKMFKLLNISYQIQDSKTVPQYVKHMDVIKVDPVLYVNKLGLQFFQCKKCRRIIAQDHHIMPHFFKEKYTWKDERWSEELKDIKICKKLYFIEPLSWMQNILTSLSGKLYCPNEKCGLKLGSFSWNAGCICPCGTKVLPGFYLIPSRIDTRNY